jgi:uncharacterized protein (UPF0333 family)
MRRKGQSTLEYAVLIAVVVGALLAMQIYMKRGIQGKLRQSADQIGEQYSAGHTTSNYVTEQVGDMVTTENFGVEAEGVSRYQVTTPATIKRSATGTGAERVTQNLSQENLFNGQ